jgi:hypothetical protein
VRSAPLLLLLALTACAGAKPSSANAGTSREELAGLQQRIALLNRSSQEIASDPDRCRKMGAVAEEVCHCADRICVLARDLAEDAAQRACVNAGETCRQFRANAESCK